MTAIPPHPQQNMPQAPQFAMATDHAQMWAQDTYAGAYYASHGPNTAAPSVMSHASSLHEDIVMQYGPQAGAPHVTVEGMYTQEDLNALQGYHPDQKHPEMCMQQQQYPVQQMQTAMPCFQSAQLNDEVVPRLIQAFDSGNPESLTRVTEFLHSICRSEPQVFMSLRCHLQLISMLARVLTMGHVHRNHAALNHGSACMYHLSCSPEGLSAIYQSRAIGALCILLDTPEPRVLSYAITTLHNLLMHQDGAKPAVRNADGIRLIAGLLRRDWALNDPSKMLAIATDCLYLLAFKHKESQVNVCKHALRELLDLLSSARYEKLLWTTTRVLKVLSVCRENKEIIIKAGGFQAIAAHVRRSISSEGSPRIRLNSMYALRNLSDVAAHLEGLESLIETLVAFLRDDAPAAGDRNVCMCACGILSNLTCKNQQNKLTVVRASGVPALLHVITAYARHPEIVEPAVCVLRHVTSRHPDAAVARSAVREALDGHGLDIVAGLFAPSSPWPLLYALVGLVRNLALCAANQALLREKNVVQILLELLRKVFGDIEKAGENGAYPGDTRMIDLIECAVAALHSVAADAENRKLIEADGLRAEQIGHKSLLFMAISLLYSQRDGVLRSACGILSELSGDRQCNLGAAMRNFGAVELLLQGPIRSQNKSVVKYASQTLYNLVCDYPDELHRVSMVIRDVCGKDFAAQWTEHGTPSAECKIVDSSTHSSLMPADWSSEMMQHSFGGLPMQDTSNFGATGGPLSVPTAGVSEHDHNLWFGPETM